MLPERDSAEFSEFIRERVKDERHRYYSEAVEHHEDMSIHVEGTTPKKILDTKRPNEPEEVKDYRLATYRPRTKAKCDKVISVISRIFNPRLYNITWEDENSELKQYLTEDYPFYRSLVNFIKETFIRKCFSDPNALLCVMPKDFETEGTDRYEPICYIYHSERVLDFEIDDWYLVDITKYEKKELKFIDKKIEKLLLIDKNNVSFIKLSDKELIVEDYNHGFDEVPAFRLGGNVKESEMPYMYESFISGVLPHWDKAVQLSSDLDAMIILHMYLEKWEIEMGCPVCGGHGKTKEQIPDTQEFTMVSCKRCHGNGYITASPFELKTVNVQNLKDIFGEDMNVPIPPMGYVDRPVEIVDKVESLRDKEMTEGLSAINMDIVDKVGENQSGVAKVIDRTDLDGFLMKIAYHIFDFVLPKIIDFTIMWMYNISNPETVKGPSIQGPVRFDVLSVNYLLEELSTAKNADIDSSVLAELQQDVTSKMFTGKQKDKLTTIIALDPFPGMDTDQIMAAKSDGTISREDHYKKIYMTQLVTEAMEKDAKFLEKGYTEKMAIIDAIIKEKLKEPEVEIRPIEERGEPESNE